MFVHTEDKQVVAHLYRGEMNRMTIYRQRLDTTTNWAITLGSAILVIYVDEKVNFYFVLFPMTIILFFSFLEARRYRYFFTAAKRVQLLEIGYFGKQIFLQQQSEELCILGNHLLHVNFLISLRDAWIVRFYRNYIWLNYISLLITLYKYMTTSHNMGHIVFLILMSATCMALHLVLYFFQHEFVDL